jgi:hypothetical protein
LEGGSTGLLLCSVSLAAVREKKGGRRKEKRRERKEKKNGREKREGRKKEIFFQTWKFLEKKITCEVGQQLFL